MNDYTYPSIYLSYLFFALMTGLAAFVFVRTARDGYWGKGGEDIKHQMFEEDDANRRKP